MRRHRLTRKRLTPFALRPSIRKRSLSRSALPSGPTRVNRIRSLPQQIPRKRGSARAERREKRQAEKRRRQLERFQKKEARKKRAAEQPEHVFPSLEAAYQFYSAASSVRLRLLLSVLTCLASILLLVLSTSAIVGDFSSYSQVFSAIMLGLLLAQALLSYDICLSGVVQALRLRFDQTSMLFVVLCAVIVDAFFAVLQGRTPFCTVASILLLLALWGRSLLYEARRRSLRAAGNMEDPVAAVREEKAWHGYDCIFRAPGDAEQFAVQLEMPDAGSRIMRFYTPVMTAVTLVLSVLTAMRGGKSFLWSWTAMLLAGFPRRHPHRLRKTVFHVCQKTVPHRRSRRRLAGRADSVRRGRPDH